MESENGPRSCEFVDTRHSLLDLVGRVAIWGIGKPISTLTMNSYQEFPVWPMESDGNCKQIDTKGRADLDVQSSKNLKTRRFSSPEIYNFKQTSTIEVEPQNKVLKIDKLL